MSIIPHAKFDVQLPNSTTQSFAMSVSMHNQTVANFKLCFIGTYLCALTTNNIDNLVRLLVLSMHISQHLRMIRISDHLSIHSLEYNNTVTVRLSGDKQTGYCNHISLPKYIHSDHIILISCTALLQLHDKYKKYAIFIKSILMLIT